MYKKILVPLDGSELAECVLPHVESIVRGCSAADVVFIRVVEPVYLPVGTLSDGISILTSEDAERIRRDADTRNEAEARDYLNTVLGRVQLNQAKGQAQVIQGVAAETLADYAKNNDIDLIIIATHGRSGVSRWVWGSVSDRILRSACVPVLMVRAPGCISGI